jgi:hypothetical protein
MIQWFAKAITGIYILHTLYIQFDKINAPLTTLPLEMLSPVASE